MISHEFCPTNHQLEVHFYTNAITFHINLEMIYVFIKRMILFFLTKFWSNSNKKLSKNGQVICGHSFLHELVYLALFSLQLADTINNFEVISAPKEEEYKKRFVKCFLNLIYFRHLEILHSSSFFTVFNFLVNYWTIFSWP